MIFRLMLMAIFLIRMLVAEKRSLGSHVVQREPRITQLDLAARFVGDQINGQVVVTGQGCTDLLDAVAVCRPARQPRSCVPLCCRPMAMTFARQIPPAIARSRILIEVLCKSAMRTGRRSAKEFHEFLVRWRFDAVRMFRFYASGLYRRKRTLARAGEAQRSR